MRQKTQTDRTRPTLCHAAGRAPAGVGEAGGMGSAGGVSDVRGPVDDRTTTRRPVRAAPWPGADNFSGQGGSKDVGAAFEAQALVFLQRQRLRFVARNVTCRGGEIDLVMRDRDGALVFVEVRARACRQFGGAAASVGWQKQQRLVRAAKYYLMTRVSSVPACRFDVIAFEGGRLVWIRDAFRVDEV